MADSERVGKLALKKTGKLLGWWFGIALLLLVIGSADGWWPLQIIGALMLVGVFVFGGQAALLTLFGIFVGSSISARKQVNAEEAAEREAAHQEAQRLAAEREAARVATIEQRAALREQSTQAQQQEAKRKGVLEQLRIVSRHLDALAREADAQRRSDIEAKVIVRLQEAVGLCDGLGELRALVQGSELLKVIVREVLGKMLARGLRSSDAGALYEALGETVQPIHNLRADNLLPDVSSGASAGRGG